MRNIFKKYISIILVVCLVIALASLAACGKKNEEPEDTTAKTTQTNPQNTSSSVPEDTSSSEPEDTSSEPEETIPADSDPKQEDVFVD